MSTVTSSAVVPGPVADAAALWFDTHRWPGFIDGFRAVVRSDPGWPDAGAIVWDSTPHGRGRVYEQVTGTGVADFEDEKMAGTQRVTFEPGTEDAVRVTLRLEYRIKDRKPLTPLIDLFFVRRAMGDAVARTVRRYAAERRSDVELAR